MSDKNKPNKIRYAPGYCDLCRAKELKLYGTILNKAGRKHTEAVKQAGCGHPATYALRVGPKPSDESIQLKE